MQEIFDHAAGALVWGANEATTRITIVDRVLNSLGWDSGSTEFEAPSGSGDFLDYLLRWCGEPWMVVEAKRAGATFHIDPTAVHSDRSHVRAIKGLMSKGGANLRDAMNQAARYANDRATPLCVVTNGLQWVFFRGMSGQKSPWTDGRALVFLSPEEVMSRFDDFVDCLAKDGRRNQLPMLLEQPSSAELPEPVIPAELLKFRRMQRDEAQAARVAVVSSFLLAEIHLEDRLEMLDRCYVSPNLTSEFDTSIRRLLKDSAEHIDGGDSEVLDGDADDFAKHVEMRERVGLKHPVVVVGHIGAGKTTFLHSAFRKMKVERLAFPAIVDLEGFGRAGGFLAAEEHRKVAERILEYLQRATAGVLKKRDDLNDNAKRLGDPFAMVTLRTLCHKPINDTRELAGPYWEQHDDQWHLKVLEIVERYKSDPVAWLVHFLRHLRHRFRRKDGLKYPVLIAIDNIDQADSDYQKCIYGLAQQLARDTPAIVIFCIREDTYREGRHPKGFLSSTPLSFVFHVKSPPLDHVLRRRLDFARTRFVGKLAPVQLGDVADEIPVWCDRLEKGLLEDEAAGAELVGALAGQNTRAALDMASRVVASGVSANEAGGPIAAVLYGLVSVSTPRTMTERLGLANVFDADPGLPVPQALGVRLLAYLHSTSKLQQARPLEEQTEVILARFSAWGYRTSLVRSALGRLLGTGLACDAQNRGSPALASLPKRISLTASGLVHLTRLSRSRHYRLLMACNARWYDRELAERFVERCQAAGNVQGCTFGDLLASTADDFFESYLQRAFGAENEQLASLQDQRWVRDVLAQSNGLFTTSIDRPERTWRESPADATERGHLTEPSTEELSLFPDPHRPLVPHGPVDLGRIPRNATACGTVWVPRILWALEWARRSGRGPVSPKEISQILEGQCDVDVAPTNISKAFRNCKTKPDADGLWKVEGRRYVVTPAGTKLIVSLIESDVR